MRYYFSILIVILALSVQAADDTNSVTTNVVAEAAAATTTTNAVAAAPTVATNAPIDPRSFEAFKLLVDRNIFDPNRRAPRPRDDRPREERPRPVRTDYLTLVGAMSYAKGAFAFFEGTRSEYRKSVKTGDTIAGYKVATVTSSNVILEAGENGEKKFDLTVGAQLRKRDEGEWELNALAETGAAATADSSTSSATTSTNSETKAESPSTDGMSDALKRLMEKRNREK